ncbi:MAG: aldo/keto reductase family protein [Candidatus Omnitrophota bacterium]
MRYRPLGRCGTKVSQFGLGGWTTFGDSVKDASSIRSILYAAYDAGVNFFDMADVYGAGETERAMGEILRDFPRRELVLSSKVFFPMSDAINDRGLSRKHIMESIDGSLRRIGADYLDIYFCHRFDEETPLEETVRAMDDLVHQGKIVYWGTSEWSGAQLSEAQLLCERRNYYPPQVEQPRYSLLARDRFENDVRPAAMKHGMGLTTFSPLAFGTLTGKYDKGLPEGSRLDQIEWLRGRTNSNINIERVRKMKYLADSLGCERSQLALAWVASQPGVSSVITGATKLEQLQENLGALSVEITEEINMELDMIFPD